MISKFQKKKENSTKKAINKVVKKREIARYIAQSNLRIPAPSTMLLGMGIRL